MFIRPNSYISSFALTYRATLFHMLWVCRLYTHIYICISVLIDLLDRGVLRLTSSPSLPLTLWLARGLAGLSSHQVQHPSRQVRLWERSIGCGNTSVFDVQVFSPSLYRNSGTDYPRTILYSRRPHLHLSKLQLYRIITLPKKYSNDSAR